MIYDPKNVTMAADALNRGIAIVNTVWLAVQRAETDEDRNRAADTLYEGQKKLEEAERLLASTECHREAQSDPR